MTAPAETPPAGLLGAVVLAGGRGSRLGGTDKGALELAGTSLLERALAAVADAAEVVVVADPVPTSRPVTWAREQPPGGGPAAGLLSGLDAFARAPDLVCALAVDMPRVTAATVRRLRAAVAPAVADWPSGSSPIAGADRLTRPTGVDGAVLVDAEGHRQPLAAVYRASALARARPAERSGEHGLPVRRLVGGLRLVEVPAVGDEARDVDTWADLRALDR